MKKFGFITNKYVIATFILLCLLLADIILHRGMSRVILPSKFSDKIVPVNLPVCNNQLVAKDKHWIRSIDNISLLEKLPPNTPGFQCNIAFNRVKKYFQTYPDSSNISSVYLDTLLTVYTNKKLTANIWFDFRNLTADNASEALQEMLRLKNKYNLAGKIIIESHNVQFLKQFCDSGFFTSYAVPYFNPYQVTENEIIHFTDLIRNNLRSYPASAVSASYFQYPVLKKFFPNYPILTKADNATISFVSYVFKRQLENEEHIRVILYPFKD